MEEIYKTIEGFENYEVSNFGHIKNKKTGRILKACPNENGYLIANFYKDKKVKSLNIHRIVGMTFLDNPDNKPQIDHIDNNKNNNNVNNLRWATSSENQMNTQKQSNNKSGIKGVCWSKSSKKWQAQIVIDGISIYLGTFDNIEDAKTARINKVNEVFGVFVNHTEKINP